MSAFSQYPVVQGTAPDADSGAIRCPGAQRMTVQIANQGVFITFGIDQGNAIVWDTSPEPYLPVTGEIVRPFDAFKWRAMTPAAQLPAGATQAYAVLTPR